MLKALVLQMGLGKLQLKKKLDMTWYLEVFTGVLHGKLRFESLLRLLVQCVLKSWCVRRRGASITSPIKSGPLA
jgi:hypothetical protein